MGLLIGVQRAKGIVWAMSPTSHPTSLPRPTGLLSRRRRRRHPRRHYPQFAPPRYPPTPTSATTPATFCSSSAGAPRPYFPLPGDALHKEPVLFRYAPLPEDLHGIHDFHACVLLQPDSLPHPGPRGRAGRRAQGAAQAQAAQVPQRDRALLAKMVDKVLTLMLRGRPSPVQTAIRVSELKDHGLTLQNLESIHSGEAGTWRSFVQVRCKELSTFKISYSKFQGTWLCWM